MILLLVGASEPAIGAVREAARSCSVDLRIEESLNPPDWVMTSTDAQRESAIRRFALPAFRVITFDALRENQSAPSDVLRSALARMVEIGPVPREHGRIPRAVARRTIPLLTEWASWVAVDDVRQTIAAHASFLTGKHGESRKAWVLFVIPDVDAFVSLSGLLRQLCRERHVVHVAITNTSREDPDLSSIRRSYAGLTVGHAPDLKHSEWRPLSTAVRSGNHLTRVRPLRAATSAVMYWIERALPPDLDLLSFFEERKPDVLIVVPHRLSESVEVEYFRTARRLGVRSLYVPLRWNDLEHCEGLRYEIPDAIAVWNEHQRHQAVNDCHVPASQIEVTGALLPSDILEGRTSVDRDAYCERMQIDPSRRIVMFEAPAAAPRTSIDRFREWRRLVKESPVADVRRAAVVAYVHNADDVPLWRRLVPTDDIAVARAGDEEKALARLNESLNAADVVMASSLVVALEAEARAKPVIALLEADRSGDSDLARFCRVQALSREGPVVARTPEESVARLSALLESPSTTHMLTEPAARQQSEDTGSLRVYRLITALSGRQPPDEPLDRPAVWRRLLIVWFAALARALDRRP